MGLHNAYDFGYQAPPFFSCVEKIGETGNEASKRVGYEL